MCMHIYILMKQTCIAIQNSNMNWRETDSPQFAAGVAPRVLGYVLSRMRLAVKSKATGRYEPALICCWWMGPGKNRKLEKDDSMWGDSPHMTPCDDCWWLHVRWFTSHDSMWWLPVIHQRWLIKAVPIHHRPWLHVKAKRYVRAAGPRVHRSNVFDLMKFIGKYTNIYVQFRKEGAVNNFGTEW